MGGRAVLGRWLLWLALWPCCLARACDFPRFMQTNATNNIRDWRSHIKEQYTEFTVSVIVEENLVRIVATDPRPGASHTRVCLQSAGAHKYLVAHEVPGQKENKYTCIQFLQRSPNVVQIKEAETSSRMDLGLCDNSKLVLNDWLIVDKNHVSNEAERCSLVGGFSIRIYDKRRHENVCDGYQGETRLESECVRGEGLTFHFRSQTCVPEDIMMFRTQRTVCLANWREGALSFSLIKHDALQYMWLLRYPSAVTDSFVAFLFYDLVADTSSGTTATMNYMRLDMVKDVPRPVSSLCVDDYEVCSLYNRPCDAGDSLALTCPRTCRLCNTTRPQPCYLGKFKGQWYRSDNPGMLALTVNNTFMTTYDRTGFQERFYCMQWDPPAPQGEDDKHITTLMMVSEFENGCKPRYTCATFLQKASSVLFVKISRGKSWPFTQSVDQRVDCSNFEFEDDKSLVPNMFKSDNFQLVYARTSNTVACDLPDGLINYSVTFRGTEDFSCSGSLLSSSDNSFVAQFHNCGTVDTSSIATSYTCVESSSLLTSSSLQVIVARSARDSEQLYCWAFPRHRGSSNGAFYLLGPDQCNESVRKKIRKGKALASFTNLRQTKTGHGRPPSTTTEGGALMTRLLVSTVATSTHKLSMDDRKSVEEEATVTPPPPGPHRPPVATGNDTAFEAGSPYHAAPVVIIAAILFFLVFQIPCNCKT